MVIQMMNNIITSKANYTQTLDSEAKKIAAIYLENKPITPELLEVVHDLYTSAKLDKYDDDCFDSAYHNPITSDFEFIIARIIYHLSKHYNLGWFILLRKQKNKCAPDIRIEKDGKTLVVIEIKVKAGWIQQIFSDRRFNYDLERYNTDKIKIHPKEKVAEVKEQFDKYSELFGIDRKNVFVLIASLSNVHRKKEVKADVNTYKRTFVRNAELGIDNLVVLSNNVNVDISKEDDLSLYEPSEDFERMLERLFN